MFEIVWVYNFRWNHEWLFSCFWQISISIIVLDIPFLFIVYPTISLNPSVWLLHVGVLSPPTEF